MMLLMMTAALAGCAGSDVTEDDVDAAREEGRAAGIAEATPVSTLDTIVDRGSMKCGVKESQYGMGYLDAATGVRSGLDISYCRAVAAALGLDPDTGVEYIPASGSDRFEKLSSGTIDVLIRTTTWTTSRDASLNADFAGMNFFDGQGILIREDRFAAAAAGNSAAGLDGANICVGIGTVMEGELQDWFSSLEIDFTSIPVADAAEATAKYIDGSCDVMAIASKQQAEEKKAQLDEDGSMSGVDIWVVALYEGSTETPGVVGNSLSITISQSSDEMITGLRYLLAQVTLFATCPENSTNCNNIEQTMVPVSWTYAMETTCSNNVSFSWAATTTVGNQDPAFNGHGLDCTHSLNLHISQMPANLEGYDSGVHELSWGDWVYSVVWESVPIESTN